MSLEDYHNNRTHLSSSSLKKLLESPSKFYEEWVLGRSTQEQNNAFDEGHFVHTLLLEPHKVGDYAVYPGLRKQGALWELFKVENTGKILLSAPQENRCRELVLNVGLQATKLLQGGQAELEVRGRLQDVPVKIRADFINIDQGYIVDVKTTSMPTGTEFFKTTIAQYKYELSASLYCSVARQEFGKDFDFYWIVLSKDDKMCKVYKAAADTLRTGACLVTYALQLYCRCTETGDWRKHPTSPNIIEEIEEV